MIITIGSIKGGVGKSTLATNIAVSLAQHKSTVCLIDADRQKSSVNWANDRSTNGFQPEIQCVVEYDKVKETALKLKDNYDFIVIDCQGRDSIELRSALVGSDILITPYKPSQLDVDTLHKMSKLVSDALELNPDLHAFAVLNMAPTHASSKEEIEDSIGAASKLPWITTLTTIIHDRKAYREATNQGAGVTETFNVKAKKEIIELLKEVLA